LKPYFESVAKFRYLGCTVTYQNLTREKIKSRLNLGVGYYLLVEILSTFYLLSKILKIKIHKTVIMVGTTDCLKHRINEISIRDKHGLHRPNARLIVCQKNVLKLLTKIKNLSSNISQLR
jgi:hypothetical protein